MAGGSCPTKPGASCMVGTCARSRSERLASRRRIRSNASISILSCTRKRCSTSSSATRAPTACCSAATIPSTWACRRSCRRFAACRFRPPSSRPSSADGRGRCSARATRRGRWPDAVDPLCWMREQHKTQETKMSQQVARTPGAKRAGDGEYVFDLAAVNHILGGPDYSTANGACVEGDRMIVALMRMPAGTGAQPHSHPNEQWIYILQGTFRARIGEAEIEAKPGSVVYVPSNVVHSGEATPEGDVVFFTCKDASHSLHGVKAA